MELMKFFLSSRGKRTNGLTKEEKKQALIDAPVGEHYFEDIFPVELIEDNLMIMKDGSISAGLRLQLPDDEALTESDLEGLNQALTSIYARQPANTTIHLQSRYYYDKTEMNGLDRGYFSRHMGQNLKDRKALSEQHVMYLCYPNNPENFKEKTPSSTFFAKQNKIFPENILEGIEARKEKAQSHITSFGQHLNKQYGITVKRMGLDSLLEEKYRYFNLDFKNKHEHLVGSFENMGGIVKMGPYYIGVVFLQRAGLNQFIHTKNNRGVVSAQGWPFASSYIRSPHLVNTSIRILDTEEKLKELNQRAKLIRGLRTFSGSRGNEKTAEEILIFIDEMHKSGLDLAQVNHNVIAWDTDPNKLSDTLEEISSAYQKMNGSVGLIDTFNAANYFFTYAPGAASSMFDPLMMPLNQSLCNTYWQKMSKGDNYGILVCNRNREPVYIDLWGPDLVNKNGFILGPSGSGKSYTSNAFITQEHENGVVQILIEIGKSYKNLVQTLGGQYNEIDQDNPFRMNPMLVNTSIDGSYLLSKDKVIFIKTVLSIMYNEPGKQFNKAEDTVLTVLLKKYYAHVNHINQNARKENNHEGDLHVPRLDRFVEFIEGLIKDKKDEDVKKYLEGAYFDFARFIIVLETFTKGDYSDIFCSDKTSRLQDNSLICYEMSEIKKDPILYPIVSLVIIEMVLDSFETMPSVRKKLILDEAFEFLSDSMSGFIEKMYRQARKHNASIYVISQNIDEIINSPAGPAIIGNSAIKILLDHSSAKSTIPKLQNFIGLTDSEVEKLNSLRRVDGGREAFLKRMDRSDVIIMEVGEHAHPAFSTDPDDRNRVNELRKRFTNQELVFDQFVEDNHR
jgi:hypothetical protein